MKKQKNNQMIIITILIISILIMSIGFAAFSTSLNLNGTATVAPSKWSVAFNPSTYAESPGSITVAAEQRTINGTSITYNVSLAKPKDFYEFSIDIENTGTFNANLTNITMSTLDPETIGKYLKYTLEYKGVTYSKTTDSLKIPLPKTNGKETLKVRVEYIQPSNPTDLPTEEVKNISLTATLTYVQDDSN